MIKLFIGLFFLGSSCAGYAEIRTASSLEPIRREIAESPKETLVLLDVGGTLLTYPGAVLHPSHDAWRYEWFHTHHPNLSKEEKISLDRIVLATLGAWQLLDAGWPEVVIEAQDHGVKVVAFTKVALDPSISASRADMLRRIGIPFKDDLPELSRGNSYEYSQGVIETECRLKGPVLEEILSSLTMRPEKIVFVDDRVNQIKSVDDACRDLEIPCVAFHYVPEATAPTLDEKIADYQFSTLVHERRWVFDGEARLELEQREISGS